MTVCIECGTPFDSTYVLQKTCSPECRRVRRNRQQMEWYYRNQEQQIDAMKQYRKDNRERYRAMQNSYYHKKKFSRGNKENEE